MFSKAKDKNAGDAKQTMAQPEMKQSASNAASMAPSKRSAASRPTAGVPSIISSDVVMQGNINAGGEVQFDGTLEGDIRASTLIVGEQAAVKGEIVCERVTVRGKVEGGIRAKQVSLAATAHIFGDIIHSALAVENGAHFEGACRHSDDPLSEASASDFRKQRPSPAPAPVKTAAPAAAPMSSAPTDAPKANGAGDAPSFLSPNRSPLR